MTKRPAANWKALRELLWTRCGGSCEVSGKRLDFDTFDLHHRRNKGMGGTSRLDTDLPSNLLALDPIVHNGGPGSVHAGRATLSGPRGWLVSKLGTQPMTAVPVLVQWKVPGFRQWVNLTNDGTYIPLSRVLSQWEITNGAGSCWPPAPMVVAVLGPLDTGSRGDRGSWAQFVNGPRPD